MIILKQAIKEKDGKFKLLLSEYVKEYIGKLGYYKLIKGGFCLFGIFSVFGLVVFTKSVNELWKGFAFGLCALVTIVGILVVHLLFTTILPSKKAIFQPLLKELFEADSEMYINNINTLISRVPSESFLLYYVEDILSHSVRNKERYQTWDLDAHNFYFHQSNDFKAYLALAPTQFEALEKQVLNNNLSWSLVLDTYYRVRYDEINQRDLKERKDLENNLREVVTANENV